MKKSSYHSVVMNQGCYFSMERHSTRIEHLKRLERMLVANSAKTPMDPQPTKNKKDQMPQPSPGKRDTVPHRKSEGNIDRISF